jgi:hypothetical protein
MIESGTPRDWIGIRDILPIPKSIAEETETVRG